MRRALSRPGFVCLALVAALLLALPAAAQFGPQYQGRGFGKNKVQYRDFDWSIYNSPHFSVYYYPETEPLLQKVVSLAESAYDELSRGFDFQIQEPIPLIFYATHSAFEQNNIILNFIPEGVGAFATPARFRMVLPVDMPDRELYELLLHELTHIFQYHMLFQGSLAKAVATVPPIWFMEGMASYMAKDETARDKMFLRDAVVNDRIPLGRPELRRLLRLPLRPRDLRLHRGALGQGGVPRLHLRDQEHHRLARRPRHRAGLQPGDRGVRPGVPPLAAAEVPARAAGDRRAGRLRAPVPARGGVAEPGDLADGLALGRPGRRLQLLPGRRRRRALRRREAAVHPQPDQGLHQRLPVPRLPGADDRRASWGATSPSRRTATRSPSSPSASAGGACCSSTCSTAASGASSTTWAASSSRPRRRSRPDGRKVAFGGWKNGQFDIFTIDFESGQIANVTNDAVFDGAPAWSPDGASLVFVSVVGEGYAKIFRVDVANPAQRFQVTTGESNENDPIFSPDGKRLYFTSDLKGPENIYSLDLATGATEQYTNVVTGAFMPTVLAEPDGKERLVYTGYWKGRFDLYVAELEEPVEEPTVTQLSSEPTLAENLPAFEPPHRGADRRLEQGGLRRVQVLPRGRPELRRRRRRPDLRRPHPALLLRLPGRQADLRRPLVGRQLLELRHPLCRL